MTTYQAMRPRYKTAKSMNTEFGRRIKSFLMGTGWWDIAQLLRSEVGADDIWHFMLAGIDPNKLSPDDYAFAEALDWGVSRQDIDLTNVSTYTYPGGNWWYVDPAEESGGQRDVTLTIWGKVALTLREEHDDETVEANAENFGRAMIRPDWLLDADAHVDSTEGDTKIVDGIVIMRAP